MSREIIQINETTYRIEDQYVRFFLLIGEKQAALLDSGVSKESALQLARSLTSKEIILINTHGDGDHTAGNGEFSEFYIGKEDYDSRNMAALYPDSRPSFLQDGQIIDLGNRPLEVILIPGHTRGSAAILDRKNRTLFSGDSVQSGHIFMFGDHRDPECFEDSLRKLEKRTGDFDVIYPSHDAPQLTPDAIGKVILSWEACRSGKLPFTEISLHGKNVKSCDASFCGFYID